MKSIVFAALALVSPAAVHAAGSDIVEASVHIAKVVKPPVTFGGFTKGQTFTFTVTDKVSAATVGSTVNENAPVPSTVPNFALGQKVTFTIGAKGELKATKTNIPFLTDAVTANNYTNKPTRTNLSPNTAIVFKNGTTPVAVNLNFFVVKVVRRIPTVTTVTYMLQ